MGQGPSEKEAYSKISNEIGDINWGYGLIKSDCSDKVNYFLAHGADAEWTPPYECLAYSPLTEACRQGHLPLVKRLLEAGAKPTKRHLRNAVGIRPCEHGRQSTSENGTPIVSNNDNRQITHTARSEVNQPTVLLITLVPPESSDDGRCDTLVGSVHPDNHYAKNLLIKHGYGSKIQFPVYDLYKSYPSS